MARPKPLTINLLVALLCLLWGSTWIVIHEGLQDLPPFKSASMRFGLSGVLMAFLAVAVGKREDGAAPRPFLWVTLGTLNFGLSYGLVYTTQTVLPSGLVAVLWGVFPMLMAVCGHLFLPGEQLRGWQWVGFVGGFAGLVLLFLTDVQKFGADGLAAAALLLVSPFVSALGTTVVKRWGAGTNSMLLNRNGMLLGAGLLLLAGLWQESDRAMQWTGTAVFSVAYLAVCGTVLTFGIYFWLLRHSDAYKLGLIAYVTPVIALFLGWMIGKETVTGTTIAGTLLILSGVVAVLRGR